MRGHDKPGRRGREKRPGTQAPRSDKGHAAFLAATFIPRHVRGRDSPRHGRHALPNAGMTRGGEASAAGPTGPPVRPDGAKSDIA